MSQCKAFFADVKEICEPQAWCSLNHKSTLVPQVDFFIAAFECDAHSSLSIYRKEGPGSLKRGTLSSAKGVLGYIQAHRPPVWLGENVRQLLESKEGAPSDVDTLRDMLAALGYELATFVIRAQAYKSPAPRDRTVAVSLLTVFVASTSTSQCFNGAGGWVAC